MQFFKPHAGANEIHVACGVFRGVILQCIAVLLGAGIVELV